MAIRSMPCAAVFDSSRLRKTRGFGGMETKGVPHLESVIPKDGTPTHKTFERKGNLAIGKGSLSDL
jgi:hypothetical protein